MLISAEKLSFCYPESDTNALGGVSLEINEGEFVTLCGASGCGKSTLLRMLKPCLQPHGTASGSVRFDGKPLSELSEREAAREIGFVAQNPEAQIVTDKVWHEIAFALESVGLEQSEIRRRVAECAEYFGLERLFRSDTYKLSGGEKQLVALAGAAALHPRLLLLDEPTSQLDPIAAHEFISAAARLNRDFGITVLIAEHRLEELLPVSDRVVVMENGGIIADCKPRDIVGKLPENHKMLAAMPAAVRIYAAADGRDNAPLTVREGRNSELCRKYLRENAPERQNAPSHTEKPILSASELWFCYDKGQDALRSASLSLYSGEVCALLGGNGSGKTTLLKALCGIIKPLRGRVKSKRGAKIAYLPQNPCAILREDSVLEELTKRGLPKTEAVELLDKFGISGELLERNPLDLSGGERQRAALAALMSEKPDVLLLDEPTKGMDAFAKEELSGLLRETAAERKAVLAVTHDVEFAARCADRCGLLFDGEIAAEGEPVSFFADNYFYTTPLSRMAKGIAENWV